MAKKFSIAKFWRDFYSDENRNFRLKLGSTLASSLFGLICGAILASIVWYIAMSYVVQALRLIYAK